MSEQLQSIEVPSRVVELLSDAKGVYGIGLMPSTWMRSRIGVRREDINDSRYCDSDEIHFDIEDDDGFDRDEGISHHEQEGEESDWEYPDDHRPLVLRPDMIEVSTGSPNEPRSMFLHTISNLRWAGCFEWRLHELMNDAALERNERFFALKEKEDRLRKGRLKLDDRKLYQRIKWGQRKRQFVILNGMLRRLIAEAADPVAMKLARRFHPCVRENIYRAAAISERARQLIDVFPALGVKIYCPHWGSEWWENASEAAQMVERGVKLRQIAGHMQIPPRARKLKPAVAHLLNYLSPALSCYLPEKTWEQRLWLRPFMRSRIGADDPDFGLWIARNVLKIGNRIEPVLATLNDVGDWVDEGRRERPRCITRRFSAEMSWPTVQRENERWHEAIARCKSSGSRYKIPAPWLPGGQTDGYDIVPLDTVEALWKEGRAMHHCVGSYDEKVARGACYIYSVRHAKKRIATVELVRIDGQVKSGQIRGRHNAQPTKEVRASISKWLSKYNWKNAA